MDDSRDRPIDARRLRDEFDYSLARIAVLEQQLSDAVSSIEELQQRQIALNDLPLAALFRRVETYGFDATLLLLRGTTEQALERDRQPPAWQVAASRARELTA